MSLIVSRTERNIYYISYTYIYCILLIKLEFSGQIFEKNLQILNSMKILLEGAELFHEDGWTDRHDETESRFSQFCEGD